MINRHRLLLGVLLLACASLGVVGFVGGRGEEVGVGLVVEDDGQDAVAQYRLGHHTVELLFALPQSLGVFTYVHYVDDPTHRNILKIEVPILPQQRVSTNIPGIEVLRGRDYVLVVNTEGLLEALDGVHAALAYEVVVEHVGFAGFF